MVQIDAGQCGRCEHFGDPKDEQIVQLRVRGVAPDSFVTECGHPTNAAQRLKVSPIGSCTGFTPAQH